MLRVLPVFKDHGLHGLLPNGSLGIRTRPSLLVHRPVHLHPGPVQVPSQEHESKGSAKDEGLLMMDHKLVCAICCGDQLGPGRHEKEMEAAYGSDKGPDPMCNWCWGPRVINTAYPPFPDRVLWKAWNSSGKVAWND